MNAPDRRSRQAGGVNILIGVVGMGVVGKATAAALSARGQTVISCDKNPDKDRWYEILNADFIMICVPEAVVPEVVEQLAKDKCKGIIVVRSTVPPGTCSQLSEKTRRTILHNPEFLRESHAFVDTVNPRFIVVGGPAGAERTALSILYMPFGLIFQMSSTESEILKLWSNAKLACNISFANEMLKICEEYGANGHFINNVLTEHPLFPNHPWQIGNRYGGHCLPKDMKQLLSVYPESVLLRAVEQVNNTI